MCKSLICYSQLCHALCINAWALHGWPWLTEFSGAVLSCIMLFCLSISLDVLLIKTWRLIQPTVQGNSLFTTMGQQTCELGGVGGGCLFLTEVWKLTANGVETSLREQKLQNWNNYTYHSPVAESVFSDNFKPPQSHVHFKTYKNTMYLYIIGWLWQFHLSQAFFFFFFPFSLLIASGCGFDCPWDWKQMFSSKKWYWFWDSVCSSLPLTNTMSTSVHHLHFQRVQI